MNRRPLTLKEYQLLTRVTISGYGVTTAMKTLENLKRRGYISLDSKLIRGRIKGCLYRITAKGKEAAEWALRVNE